MSNGKRRAANPGRSDETRIAPEEDADATRDIPLLTHSEEDATADIPLITRAEETRMAPLETGALETRMAPLGVDDSNATRLGPMDGQPARAGKPRGRAAEPAGPSQGDIITDVRSQKPPADVRTEVTSQKPPAAKTGAAKATGWLAKGGEKRVSAAPEKVGVVRLNPLEPAKGKAAAAEDESPALRTMFANHSALLAEQLRSALSSKMYGRGPHRVLRIDEPEGPSTAGGKLARQAISLVPRKGTGPSVMCGWVDVSKREAQLRNFEGVAKRYESHHGEPLEMQAEEYERFLQDVEEVLIKAVIKVRLIVPEEQAAVRVLPSASARRKGVPGFWALTLAVLAFLLGLYVGRMPG
ncbi:hypothetical protein [Pyxidicoccus trucidator]|uniref:hypothetical protein n=1 Tax=Pyxidicoccus trucidator TaxID=2709662 RepID=UPI0013DD2294|nr:hypothetical protein [Pyxidicoccus trucidator]